MSKLLPGNQKHLNLDCRITIEKELDKQTPMRRIAKLPDKDPTTISKEIKKHRICQPHNSFNEPGNQCSLFKDCKKKHICQIFQPVCKKLCRSCRFCNSRCPDFRPKDYHCPKLDRLPMSAMAVKIKQAAGLIKPITELPSHKENTELFFWNQEQG